MKIRIRIPKIHVVNYYKKNSMHIALGLVEDRDIAEIEWSKDENKCCGNENLCNKIYNIIGSGLLKIRLLEEKVTHVDERTIILTSLIIKNIINKGTFTLTDILKHKHKISALDPVIACLIGFGGIVLSIWKDPKNPICLRMPVSDKYIIDIGKLKPEEVSKYTSLEIAELIEKIWSDSIGKELVTTWGSDTRKLGLIKAKDKPVEATSIRTVGIIVEVKP